MKHGGQFLVMRYGPPYGRPAARWIVSVFYVAFTLEDAIARARASIFGRLWIVATKAPAHRRPRDRSLEGLPNGQ